MAVLIQEGVEAQDWNDLDFDRDVRIADFVEKRFAGMNENNLMIEHDINLAVRRLEHMADSPRKDAARVIIDLYKQTLLDMADLGYEANVLVEAGNLAFTLPRDEISNRIRADRGRMDRENRAKLEKTQEDYEIYQNMMATFFAADAIKSPKGNGQLDQSRIDAQNRVLAEINKKLPAGHEYDLYRTMEGYADRKPEPLAPQAANLIMNSNVLTDVSADNYLEKIHVQDPKRVDLEWGASTFDNMMDELYNNDERKVIKRKNKNFLETVFLDGRPALEVLPGRKENENEQDYMRRMKCEVVAYALEGRGKIDIAPFKVTAVGFEYKDPVPVHVKVNLKEEVSLWRRFKSYLGITSKPTKKHQAEKISLDELGKEERHSSIQAKLRVREMAERENDRIRMKAAVEKSEELSKAADKDFFGFLIQGKAPKEDQTETDLIKAEFDRIPFVKISTETMSAMEIPETDREKGQIVMMKTLHRAETRVALIRGFALKEGMSLEDVLSDAPELREKKAEIGKKFVNMITVLGEEEYAESAKRNGLDADYKKYFQARQQQIYDTLNSISEHIVDMPFDFFRDPAPKKLAEDYVKADSIITMTQDLFQCCPGHVMKCGYDKMNELQHKVRCIGELHHVREYCRSFMAADAYVDSKYDNPKDVYKVTIGAAERSAMVSLMAKADEFQKREGVKTLGMLRTVADREWAFSHAALSMDIHGLMSNEPQEFEKYKKYAHTGDGPIVFRDPDTMENRIESPEMVRTLEMARENKYLKELTSFEEISMRDIQISRRNHMTPKELAKEQKELEKQRKAQEKEQRKLGK